MTRVAVVSTLLIRIHRFHIRAASDAQLLELVHAAAQMTVALLWKNNARSKVQQTYARIVGGESSLIVEIMQRARASAQQWHQLKVPAQR